MMKPNDYDVLIVGAGAAGLMAAVELSQAGKKVGIIEAKDRIGGRMQTMTDNRFPFPVEAGAEFIHGDLPLTFELLKKADIEPVKVKGAMWRHDERGFQKEENEIGEENTVLKKLENIEQDISIQSFIDQHLSAAEYSEARESLKSYVEGYYAADTNDASTLFLKEEWQRSDEEQYRVQLGYQALVNYLHRLVLDGGCTILLQNPIREVHWHKDKVELRTTKHSFTAQKIIITAPIGVLQTNMIQYYPALPHISYCASKLGFGTAIKIIVLFDEAFWKNESKSGGESLDNMAFLFSDETVPTWWTMEKETPLLVGWLAGPKAKLQVSLSEDELLQKALHSLSQLFGTNVMTLHKKLLAWHVANWGADFYTRGGYSYETIHSKEARKKLKDPVDNTLFFAGEGLYEGTAIGTVEAALCSGRDTAQQLLANW